MKVKSESEVAQLCLTPSDPMDCSLPGSSVHGIFQARVLKWGAIAFSKVDELLGKILEGFCQTAGEKLFLKNHFLNDHVSPLRKKSVY